jgi:hypothetical protein
MGENSEHLLHAMGERDLNCRSPLIPGKLLIFIEAQNAENARLEGTSHVFCTRVMAEGVRFELTKPFGSPVFKTGAINHSATLP